MMMKKLSSVVLVSLVIGISLYSCKDMGSEVKPAFTATTLSVTLGPGGQATVTISGGRPPYTISRQPSAQLASATLTNNSNGTGSLVIQAVSSNVSGTTTMKVKDTDSHSANDSPLHEEDEIEITIRVNATVILFGTQVQPIFTASCVNSGCHPGGGAPFSLQSSVSYANLVNVNATTGPCAGDKRVLPGNAAASALIKRLDGTCGSLRMPLGGGPLPQAQVDVIRDWINQGAQNN